MVRIIAAGSSKLDIYKKSGDSLMGRYFPYQMQQLSLSELSRHDLPEQEISKLIKTNSEDFEKMVKMESSLNLLLKIVQGS